MENAIIIGLLLVILYIALKASMKHLKGQGGCCGGGSEVKVKRKKLKRIVARRLIYIEGMTCEHCKNRVESRLNELEGISAKVNLKNKTATVLLEKEVSDERLQRAVENAGYEVVEIKAD